MINKKLFLKTWKLNNGVEKYCKMTDLPEGSAVDVNSWEKVRDLDST